MRYLFLAAAFSFGLAFSSTQSAQAASIDCKAVTSAFDKVICGDPKLSALYDEEEKTYDTLLAATPEDERFDLQSGQLQWRDFIAVTCVPAAGKDVKLAEKYCPDALRAHISGMKLPTHLTLGGIDFRTVGYLKAIPTNSPERNAGVIGTSYLQIVHPANVSQAAFNEYLSDRHRTSLAKYFIYMGERAEDEDLGYSQSIKSVGPGMITFDEDTWVNAHGASSSDGFYNKLTWNVAEMRPLSFFDVFKKDADAEFRFLDILKGRADDDFVGDDPESMAAARKKFLLSKEGMVARAKAHNTVGWTVLAEGLLLTFQHGEIRSQKGGYLPCHFLSWKELEGLVDMESIKRLTAGPIVYAPEELAHPSECNPNYKPKE